MKEQIKREPYQTDLSDDEWQRFEPYIPKPKTNRVESVNIHTVRF